MRNSSLVSGLGQQREGKPEDREVVRKDEVVLDIGQVEKGDVMPDVRRSMSTWRTDLDRFKDEEIHLLVQHGYIVARSRLARILHDGTEQREPWTPKRHLRESDTHDLAKATKNSHQRRFWPLRLADNAAWALVSLLMLNAAFLVCLIYRNTPTTPDQIGFSKVGLYDPTSQDEYNSLLKRHRIFSSLMLAYERSLGVYAVTGPLRESINQRPLSTFRCRIVCTNNYRFNGFVFLKNSKTGTYQYLGSDAADQFAVPPCASVDTLLVIGIVKEGSGNESVKQVPEEKLNSILHLERVYK